MEFGLFDHCERQTRPAALTYRDRFKMVVRAEEHGFYAYHLAEHHGTSLCLTPSPNLFLAALSQHTSKIRLGPMVCLLPFYNPYRLAQEICMLDNMSDGRLELGIGRGANPIELGFFGVPPAESKERFREALMVIIEALTTGRLDHHGQYLDFTNVLMDARVVQKPYPPLWYPSSGTDSLGWAAERGFNTILNGPLHVLVDAVKIYRDAFVPGVHGTRPKIGLTRYVYLADSDEEAYRTGKQAYDYHKESFAYIARAYGISVKSPTMPPDELADAVRTGWAAVGSPATVREQLAAIFDKVGNNYFLFSPLMADLSLEWGLRTLDLFANEIMPAFAEPALL